MRLEGEKRSFFSSKGQISMEFITFLGVILVLFALASYAAVISSRDIAAENEVTDARRIASIVAYEINIAKEVGTGYSHRFSLPASLYGDSDYAVNLSENNFVSVLWKGRSYSLPVTAENITGIVKKGPNTIRNVNGVIAFD